MPRSLWRYALWAAVLIAFAPAPSFAQPVIVLDYQYDTNGFFGDVGSPQRLALQAAATRLQSRLSDNLGAISPDGVNNTWTARFSNPADFNAPLVEVPNLNIAQHEIRVFAGGSDLTGNTLGVGGPGGFSAGGFQPFLDSLRRGQAGYLGAPASQTDFGPWGGSITFDTSGTAWNFSLAGPVAGQADFYSVALHELGHLLGFGTANSFKNLAPSPPAFNGLVSNGLLPGVQVTGDRGHWAEGTMYGGQEVAMDPSIIIGTRKEFTELDFAGLDDMGWQVTPIPEPTTVVGVAALGLAGAWGARRRMRRAAA
jgi:hypothetical protein